MKINAETLNTLNTLLKMMDIDSRSLLEALRSGQADSSEEIFASSIQDAYSLLQMNMDPRRAAYRRKLVDYITDEENGVLSDCTTAHNFVMSLFRVGDYHLGLRVCEYALKSAPYHRDILGDAIRACGSSSQWEEGDRLLKKAEEIPKEKWSYRLFLYSVDYLKNKLAAYPLDESLCNKAKSLAEKFTEIFPYDEHGYNQRAEILLEMNERAEAVRVLQEAIFSKHPDEKDSKSILVTAQCCATLLDILDDSSDYDKIIRICERGLRNSTQEQPSANIGYFVYRKALALDAKAHKENFQIQTTVDQALKFYQSAYDLNQNRDYGLTIEQRYAVLRPYAKDFQPLVKRRPTVDEMAPAPSASRA